MQPQPEACTSEEEIRTYNTTITDRTNPIAMTATLTYTLLLGAIYLLRKIFTLKEQTA